MLFWAGVALIIVGLALLIAEVHVPGFFIAVPGTILLLLGLGMLFIKNMDIITASLIVIISAVGSSLFTLWFYRKLGEPELPTTTTPDQFVGAVGTVIKDIEPGTLNGKVRIKNQVWSATANQRIEKGKTVRVRGAEGVHLIVEEVK